jgi:hypothetical protein
MNTNELKRLRREAREAELQLIERDEPGGLHVTVIGERVVHWWPDSRRRTVYVEGSGAGRAHGTANTVVKLASGAA